MPTLQYLIRYVTIIGLYAYVWKIVCIVCEDIRHVEKATSLDRRLIAIEPGISTTGEIGDYRFDTRLSLIRDPNGQTVVTSEVLPERDAVVFCRTNRCYVYVTRGVNGVFLNGERVDRLRPIRAGDIIEVNGSIFEYRE